MQLRAWLNAFIFTQLVEVPIYYCGLLCSLLAAAGASTITHPIVWFGFFTRRWPAAYLTKVVSAELFAWLGEAAYFRFLIRTARKRGAATWGGRVARQRPSGLNPEPLTLLRAILWSAVANASSLGLGLLSRRLFGVP